jgi:hypothetical protein
MEEGEIGMSNTREEVVERLKKALRDCMNEFAEYMYDDPGNRNTRDQHDKYLEAQYGYALKDTPTADGWMPERQNEIIRSISKDGDTWDYELIRAIVKRVFREMQKAPPSPEAAGEK